MTPFIVPTNQSCVPKSVVNVIKFTRQGYILLHADEMKFACIVAAKVF